MRTRQGKRKRRTPYPIGDSEILTFSWTPTNQTRKSKSEQRRSDERAMVMLVVCLAITLWGIASAWLSVIPVISVSQAQPLDPANPFSVPFIVSNDGPLSVKSLNFTCVPISIETSHQSRSIPSGFHSERVSINKLESHQKSDFPCTFRPFLGSWEFSPSQSMTMAKIDIFLEYRPAFVPWKRTLQFRFATFPDRDGKLYWQHSSIPEHWRHADED